MVGSTLFSQLLSLINRRDFECAVRRHQADKGAKGFSSWDQFVAMLFSQVAGADTLREICGGLATSRGKIIHLGLKKSPGTSTLAYANQHRPWQLYETLFHDLLSQCQAVAAERRRPFRFNNQLYSLDSTTVDLCLSIFDWAHFRRAKGAVKLHLLLDHQGYLPCWALITDGKTHDVRPARTLSLPAGAIVAMDRGYNDYALFGRWTDEGVHFVTRLKENACYDVQERREVPLNGKILSDEIIFLSGTGALEKCPHPLRRVVVLDKEHDREIVLLTNQMTFAASTIGAIYKERWQIELFFKAIKQNLKIKTFVGTSENAVKTQIWIALIAILLLKFLQMKARWSWSLSNLSALLRLNLLTQRDLWDWLHAPFAIPPDPPPDPQMTLFGN